MLGWFWGCLRKFTKWRDLPKPHHTWHQKKEKNQSLLAHSSLLYPSYIRRWDEHLHQYSLSNVLFSCSQSTSIQIHTTKIHGKGLVDSQQSPISHRSYRLTVSKFLKIAKHLHYIMQTLKYWRSHKKVRKVLLLESGWNFSTVRFLDWLAFYKYW